MGELLTKSLVSLYEEPEKPNDAVNYLKKSVGGTDNDKVEIDKLQAENTDLKSKIAALEESQAKLQAKLAELEKEKAGSSGTEEDKPAPMEEAEDTPAVAAAPAPAETAPEPEPTKETEAPVVESTTGKLKPLKPVQMNPWKQRLPLNLLLQKLMKLPLPLRHPLVRLETLLLLLLLSGSDDTGVF